MKKYRKIVVLVCMIITMIAANCLVVQAEDIEQSVSDLQGSSEKEFKSIINEINNLKKMGITDEHEIKVLLDQKCMLKGTISDIWNALTDAEQVLVIRYPFAALKVNTAKNIATTWTEKKFEFNGLGDKSDAFRHAIWNAEMTILIGEEKAELFATAHEDKDTTGIESDGYLKEEHKNMDLHNNKEGRKIGVAHSDASEEEIAKIIFELVCQDNSPFIWLHE